MGKKVRVAVGLSSGAGAAAALGTLIVALLSLADLATLRRHLGADIAQFKVAPSYLVFPAPTSHSTSMNSVEIVTEELWKELLDVNSRLHRTPRRRQSRQSDPICRRLWSPNSRSARPPC